MKIPTLTLGLLMVWAPAYAEDRDGNRDRTGGGRGAGFFLRGADKDGDGAVSFEEFANFERVANLPEEKRKALFARLDKDGDGFIRRDELPKPPQGNGDRPPLAMRQLDTNRDGAVDYEEFLEAPFAKRMPEERRRPFFDRLDRNGDGKVSPADRPRGGGRDGKGRPARPDLLGIFPRLDANDDGSLDFEEFRKAPGIDQLGEDAQEDRFEELDKNNDLKLDRSEIAKARPGPDRGRGPRDGKPDRRPNERPDAPDRPDRGPRDRPNPSERPGGDPPMMEEGA